MAEVITYLGIDYGHVRIGLAVGDSEIRLAQPHTTLEKVSEPAKAIAEAMRSVTASQLVVGLPRSLDGEDTIQTAAARAFAAHLEAELGCPVYLVDEAGTSGLAEERLRASGRHYTKADIDQTAAALILQDYLDNL